MNYFDKYNWALMLNRNPVQNFNITEYHNLLCPKDDYPEFLPKYTRLPLLQRLKGIGLLCGTDWTKLYKNRFYYSRFDHSVGVALIVWHFTHNKAQTIAGLLHDISTPTFSHVSDFRKGDALTQTATEEPTASIIRSDVQLQKMLELDGLTIGEVEDYHLYPIADNEIPRLSADRLEYMFPSGMSLDGSWTMEEVARCYKDIVILKNEDGIDELGFKHTEIAEEYCRHFCMIGHILQLNENKLTLQLLGVIMNQAVELKILSEQDFMKLSEQQVTGKIEFAINSNKNLPDSFANLYRTFRNMTFIEHTNKALPPEDYFSVSLKVKQRYINPLVKDGVRLSSVSESAEKLIEDFLLYEDSKYGCVKIQKE